MRRRTFITLVHGAVTGRRGTGPVWQLLVGAEHGCFRYAGTNGPGFFRYRLRASTVQ
jgi:hypothetical protein